MDNSGEAILSLNNPGTGNKRDPGYWVSNGKKNTYHVCGGASQGDDVWISNKSYDQILYASEASGVGWPNGITKDVVDSNEKHWTMWAAGGGYAKCEPGSDSFSNCTAVGSYWNRDYKTDVTYCSTKDEYSSQDLTKNISYRPYILVKIAQ